MQLLIEHGRGCQCTGWEPLDAFASGVVVMEVLKFAQLLIEHGADVNALDGNRKTPLHLASSRGRTRTYAALIEHGADVNAQDQDHSTPLHLASFSGRPETVQLLIEHGADVNAQDGNHSTPLHLALSILES